MHYADYVLAIFNSPVDIQFFLNVVNNQHPNFRFTWVEASDPSLPVLDVEVTICDREFDVSDYYKPTFTGLLLHFNSAAPSFWKQGLITCLSHLSCLYESNDSLLKTENNFIFSLCKQN